MLTTSSCNVLQIIKNNIFQVRDASISPFCPVVVLDLKSEPSDERLTQKGKVRRIPFYSSEFFSAHVPRLHRDPWPRGAARRGGTCDDLNKRVLNRHYSWKNPSKGLISIADG